MLWWPWDAFRTRLRMFPSLVNCCTIDWFHLLSTRFFTSLSPLPCFSFFLVFPLLILPSYSYTFYLLLLFFPPSQSWPDDALTIVACRLLDDIEMSLSDEVKEGCVVMCKELHQPAQKLSDHFLAKDTTSSPLLPILSSSPPTRHFSQREEGGCLFLYVFFVEKKALRSSWDLNLDHLSVIQTLPTEPLEIWLASEQSIARCL